MSSQSEIPEKEPGHRAVESNTRDLSSCNFPLCRKTVGLHRNGGLIGRYGP